MKTRTSRFKSIDALRGIAAILVIVLHVSQEFLRIDHIRATGKGMLDFLQLFDLGRIGITIFFIISGFVICKSFNPRKKELKSFAIKRFFRLYPLFWFSLIIGALVLWPKQGYLPLGIREILANFTMLPAFFGAPFVIGLYWTLETELIFYLLAGLLYRFGFLKKSNVLIVLTLILYVLIYFWLLNPSLQPYYSHWLATPYHLSLMLFGVSMRYAYDGDKSSHKLDYKKAAMLHFCIIMLVPIYVFADYLLRGVAVDISDASAYFTGIVLFLIGLRLLTKAPAALVYLGTISYSLYLLHPIVFTLVRRQASVVPAWQGYHISIYIIICIIGSILLSALTYHLLEAPANNLGRKLSKRFSNPS